MGLADDILGMVQAVLSRGVLSTVDAAKLCQELQVVIGGQTYTGVEHWQPYGLSARPLPGAEVLAGALGGDNHLGILCVQDRRYRPTGQGTGDVCLYDHRGQRVSVDATGVVLDAATTTATGALAVTGAVSAGNGATGAFTSNDGPPKIVTVVNGIVTAIV